MFSLLGQFATCPSSNGQLFSVGMGDYDQRKFSTEGTGGAMNTKGMLRQKNKLCCCGCHKVDGLLEKHRKAAIGSNCWIQIVCDPREICGRNIRFIPKLHHIHWNGQIVSQCDVHVCKSWLLYCMIYVQVVFICGGNSLFCSRNFR